MSIRSYAGAPKRVAVFVGTRAQAIRAAALLEPLRELGHGPLVLDTGEDGSAAHVMAELGIEPSHPITIGETIDFTRGVQVVAELLLRLLRPVIVVVDGDSATTLGAARAARATGIAVAHLEAGMRSGDLSQPEEPRRMEVDRLADLRFCSGRVAVENLEREGIRTGVHRVGDLGVDAVLRFRSAAAEQSTALADRQVEPGRYLFLTAHRASLAEPGRLDALVAVIERLPGPVVWPVAPRTDGLLRAAGLYPRLEAIADLRRSGPLGYLDTLELVRHARRVLTDSGPLTKEAYVLGVPVLTLRGVSEWQETVDAGWNQLVGLDPAAALAALAEPPPDVRPELYGDGRAGQSIAQVLADAAL